MFEVMLYEDDIAPFAIVTHQDPNVLLALGMDLQIWNVVK